jgi:hypothetical protein
MASNKSPNGAPLAAIDGNEAAACVACRDEMVVYEKADKI